VSKKGAGTCCEHGIQWITICCHDVVVIAAIPVVVVNAIGTGTVVVSVGVVVLSSMTITHTIQLLS